MVTLDPEIIARAVVVVDGHLLVCRAHDAANSFLPGGHVEPGEPLAAALRRELLEEAGVDVDEVEPIGLVEHVWHDGARHRCELNHVFTAHAPALAPPAPPASREPSLSFAWLALDDLKRATLLPQPLCPLVRLTAAGWRGAFFESTRPEAVDLSRLVIRGIRPADADALRAARLYALAETPTAFGATLAGELAEPTQRWRGWASNDGVAPDDRGRVKVTFVAADGDILRGMATGVRGIEGTELVAMWVHPLCRGGGADGVGARLVTSVIGWARAAGAEAVTLWVSLVNPRARRFYQRLGFVATGELDALKWRPSVLEERMRLPLA